MRRNHPEFGVWHLDGTPVKHLPCGALIKWFDRVIQFGFHQGDGVIAWRDGLIRAADLKTDPGLPRKEKTCVLAREGRAVVFAEAAARAQVHAGRHKTRQEFIAACLGEELADWGDFPVWIFERCGGCCLHPVSPEAVYEKNEGKNLP